ncbi:hypothetical protein BDQ12DRAFT_217762 [Crucibulum laeve]|uniref:Uncharacterized protein n=1 Tax=Crucibulum laeve TaxID=68775 RepID=A0A5C3LEI9_9AGAR|nr:hypothetical protein BDQ12DRAFT_217762 [Crucibulum laeve]
MLKEGRLVTKKKYGCLGYIPCPDYGNPINRVRPIHYAIEKAKFPDLAPFNEPSFVTDDKVDDYVPEPPKPANPPVGNGAAVAAGQVVISAELNQRLTSIDSSLSRIATALELLVEKLAAK